MSAAFIRLCRRLPAYCPGQTDIRAHPSIRPSARRPRLALAGAWATAPGRRRAFSYTPCFCRLTARPASLADSEVMPKTRTETSPAQTPHQPAASKGMPAREPQAQSVPPGQPESFKDDSAENSLELPHMRDQAVDMTSGQTSPLIKQAGKDLQAGRKDTSKAAEMDKTYKKIAGGE